MDMLPDMETFSLWLVQYGSFALFGLLALGIIALPVPEETLMVLAGILMFNEKLHITETIIAACAGSIFGITVSYALGKTVGNYFLHRYGKWVGIKERQIRLVHEWFEKYGKWTLLIGYFIPGVRHLTGFSAGTSTLEYHRFALFAYTGAVIWVSTFLSIGYFFGNYWLEILGYFTVDIDHMILMAITVFAIALGVYLYFKFKKK
jgi:membrane protein DedA with SNARE-associated domain